MNLKKTQRAEVLVLIYPYWNVNGQDSLEILSATKF